jgi:hypothetical protein
MSTNSSTFGTQGCSSGSSTLQQADEQRQQQLLAAAAALGFEISKDSKQFAQWSDFWSYDLPAVLRLLDFLPAVDEPDIPLELVSQMADLCTTWRQLNCPTSSIGSSSGSIDTVNPGQTAQLVSTLMLDAIHMAAQVDASAYCTAAATQRCRRLKNAIANAAMKGFARVADLTSPDPVPDAVLYAVYYAARQLFQAAVVWLTVFERASGSADALTREVAAEHPEKAREAALDTLAALEGMFNSEAADSSSSSSSSSGRGAGGNIRIISTRRGRWLGPGVDSALAQLTAQAVAAAAAAGTEARQSTSVAAAAAKAADTIIKNRFWSTASLDCRGTSDVSGVAV